MKTFNCFCLLQIRMLSSLLLKELIEMKSLVFRFYKDMCKIEIEY